MTPKDKAEELIHKYILNTPVGFHFDDAKQCALIAVDEIIKETKLHDKTISDDDKRRKNKTKTINYEKNN